MAEMEEKIMWAKEIKELKDQSVRWETTGVLVVKLIAKLVYELRYPDFLAQWVTILLRNGSEPYSFVPPAFQLTLRKYCDLIFFFVYVSKF